VTDTADTTWATPEGAQAAVVLAWVNRDPAGRAAEGLRKAAVLADGAATTRGLREVQDIARVLARLVPEGTRL
jgi:hypothetical protein